MRKEVEVNEFGDTFEVYSVELGEVFGFKRADIDDFLKRYRANVDGHIRLEYLTRLQEKDATADRKGYVLIESIGTPRGFEGKHLPHGMPLHVMVSAGFLDLADETELDLFSGIEINVFSAGEKYEGVGKTQEYEEAGIDIECEEFVLSGEDEEKPLYVPATLKALRELKFQININQPKVNA